MELSRRGRRMESIFLGVSWGLGDSVGCVFKEKTFQNEIRSP